MLGRLDGFPDHLAAGVVYGQIVINRRFLGIFLLGLLIEFQGLLRLIHLIFQHRIAQQHPDVVGDLLHCLLVRLFGLRELATLDVKLRNVHEEFDAGLALRFQGNRIVRPERAGGFGAVDD